MIVFKTYESMKKHTSFKSGGEAKFYFEPKSLDEFIDAIKLCKKEKRKYFILGNGSNVLCLDKGYNGVVICTKNLQNYQLFMYENEAKIVCEAGVLLTKLNKFMAELGLSGMEWSYGIPATVGGATYMNAGAFKGEMFQSIEFVEVYHRGKIKRLEKNQINFSYRNGGLKGKEILKVGLKLSFIAPSQVEALQMKYLSKRIATQPLEKPSAGSVFKRKDDIFPAQIIDKLGLKGVIIGKAQISPKHAGFIVNLGNASTSDYLKLVELIENKVFVSTGIKFEREVIVMEDGC